MAWLAGQPIIRPSVVAAPVCLRCPASPRSPRRAPVGHRPPTQDAPRPHSARWHGMHGRPTRTRAQSSLPHFPARAAPTLQPPQPKNETRTIRVHGVRCWPELAYCRPARVVYRLLVVRCVPARWAGRLFTSLDSRSLPPFFSSTSTCSFGLLVRERAAIIAVQCARSPRLLGSSVPAWFGFAPLRRYRRLCAPPFNVTDETGCLYGLSFGQSFPSSITWPKEKRCVMHCMWSSRYSLGEHMHACPKYQCGGMV